MKRILLALCIVFLFCSTAWATPDHTVCPSGCDFDNLQAAVAHLAASHAVLDSPTSIIISGTWSSPDTTVVNISGITTSETNTLTILTTGSARHDGVYSTSKYLLDIGYYAGTAISVGINYVTIDGIQVRTNHNDNISVGSSTNIFVKNSILTSQAEDATAIGIGSNGSAYVFNNIIFDVGVATYTYYAAQSYFYNNTVYGCTTGFGGGQGGTEGIFKNNIAYDNGADYSTGSVSSSSTHNLSKDGTAPTYGTYYANKTLTFNNITGKDYHLISSDTYAIDKGTDLSGTFTTDIDGDTRSGTWDLGADEYNESSDSQIINVIED